MLQERFYCLPAPLAGIFTVLSVPFVVVPASSARAQALPEDNLETLRHGSQDAIPAWQRGVGDKQREHARKLFKEGNAKAHDFLFDEAAERYAAALTYWEHPGIYYNLSKALVALGRPLEAYHITQRALQYGPTPLGADPHAARQNYNRMLQQRQRLKKRLAEIEIVQHNPEYKAFVDNETMAPDSDTTHVLLPGRRRVVIQRRGHRTLVHTVFFDQGDVRRFKLVSVQPFEPWQPWAVAGVGAGLTLAGAAMYWSARAGRDSLGESVNAQCPQPKGCPDSEARSVDGAWQKVQWKERLGSGAMLIGASAMLIGAGLLLWNLKRDIRMEPVDHDSVVLSPVVSRGMVGFAGNFSF